MRGVQEKCEDKLSLFVATEPMLNHAEWKKWHTFESKQKGTK